MADRLTLQRCGNLAVLIVIGVEERRTRVRFPAAYMSRDTPPRHRCARLAFVATVLGALALPAFAADGDLSRWLAYIAFVGAALIVVVMLLKEALGHPSDESPVDVRPPERGDVKRDEAQRETNERASRRLA